MLISGSLLFVAVFIYETTIAEATWWPFSIDHQAKNLAWYVWHLQWLALLALVYFLPGTSGFLGITLIVLFPLFNAAIHNSHKHTF